MGKGGFRPTAGRKPGIKETKPRNRKGKKLKTKKDSIPDDIKADAEKENLDPLTYMLKVMNDPIIDVNRRDRMAVAAAPFCHTRKGEGLGKKEEKTDRAKSAGAGRFASGKPPLKLVKNN